MAAFSTRACRCRPSYSHSHSHSHSYTCVTARRCRVTDGLRLCHAGARPGGAGGAGRAGGDRLQRAGGGVATGGHDQYDVRNDDTANSSDQHAGGQEGTAHWEGGVTLFVHVGVAGWLSFMPLLREAVERAAAAATSPDDM
eukprot:9482283-Pyramimonas_sp.AAC.1